MDAGWRWIFAIEGIITIVVAAGCYFFLPNSIETASFLSPEEKALGIARLRRDRPVNHTTSADGGFDANTSPHSHEKLEWSEVRRGFLSLQTWLSASGYFAVLSGLYSFGLCVFECAGLSDFAEDPGQVSARHCPRSWLLQHSRAALHSTAVRCGLCPDIRSRLPVRSALVPRTRHSLLPADRDRRLCYGASAHLIRFL